MEKEATRQVANVNYWQGMLIVAVYTGIVAVGLWFWWGVALIVFRFF